MRTAKTARKHASRMLEMVGMDAMSQRERDEQEAQLKRHTEQVLMPVFPLCLNSPFWIPTESGALLDTQTQKIQSKQSFKHVKYTEGKSSRAGEDNMRRRACLCNLILDVKAFDQQLIQLVHFAGSSFCAAKKDHRLDEPCAHSRMAESSCCEAQPKLAGDVQAFDNFCGTILRCLCRQIFTVDLDTSCAYPRTIVNTIQTKLGSTLGVGISPTRAHVAMSISKTAVLSFTIPEVACLPTHT